MKDSGRPSNRLPKAYPNGRPGKFIVILAVNPEMRARFPDSPLSLDEALGGGREQREADRGGLPDLEAEP
jgi:hypothetical protein